ncbi:DUF1127 domain-containing protein [Roseomonas sp. HJA6]|uniref:DUF1127 domain-containing protein n=1 Tax=Roseomonas alba TaxID=2846776 RepID=A0ABS7A4V5_9PROT|nr:DUF1127 domain-containing protein [Neoroseomonas alba]MBW6397323.1 DUF1127 domain-containing protein [Neoroseomonas alba]
MITRSEGWTVPYAPRKAGVLETLLAAVAAAMERHRQRARLATLEPRLLRDIGATLDEAQREASKPCWRR